MDVDGKEVLLELRPPVVKNAGGGWPWMGALTIYPQEQEGLCDYSSWRMDRCGNWWKFLDCFITQIK